MDYPKYLRSQEWAVRRAEVLARDKSRCQDCGSREGLHVHHLTYADAGKEPHWQLLTVCGQCHLRRHNRSVRRVAGRTFDSAGSDTRWRRKNWPELKGGIFRSRRKTRASRMRLESFHAGSIYGMFGGDA